MNRNDCNSYEIKFALNNEARRRCFPKTQQSTDNSGNKNTDKLKRNRNINEALISLSVNINSFHHFLHFLSQ